jgi:hypothetical protein
MMPTVADYRTRNLLTPLAPVLERPAVTAEVAGSSPVVPATISWHIFRNCPSTAARTRSESA